MIITKEKQETVLVADKIECDICHEKFICGKDWIEVQECHHISFRGGYGSVFGDMTKVECDICQHCLKELLMDHIRLSYDEDNEV